MTQETKSNLICLIFLVALCGFFFLMGIKHAKMRQEKLNETIESLIYATSRTCETMSNQACIFAKVTLAETVMGSNEEI